MSCVHSSTSAVSNSPALLTATSLCTVVPKCSCRMPWLSVTESNAPLAVVRYLYQSPSAIPFALLSTTALGIAAAIDEATGAVTTWEDSVISIITVVVCWAAQCLSA